MSTKEAWRILLDKLDHGYEGDELVEMANYIAKFEEATDIIQKLVEEAS